MADKFIEFKMMIENQLPDTIKCNRTDNGSEYIHKRFDQVCLQAKIIL